MKEDLVQSRYSTPEVDCPSEEQTVRLALEGKVGIKSISVDFGRKEITVVHTPEAGAEKRISNLIPFKAVHLESTSFSSNESSTNLDSQKLSGERRVLLWLLSLNFAMFLIEVGTGIYAQSSGLVADGIDMLADSLVYLISILSIGMGLAGRVRATRVSALFQGSLGILTLAQALWRFIFGSDPEPAWMTGISALALAVNVSCLLLISKFRTGRMHMQASFIFSANDVVANLSVIAAGAVVAWTGSRYPDLIVGVGICLLVLRGAIKINRLAQSPSDQPLDAG